MTNFDQSSTFSAIRSSLLINLSLCEPCTVVYGKFFVCLFICVPNCLLNNLCIFQDAKQNLHISSKLNPIVIHHTAQVCVSRKGVTGGTWMESPTARVTCTCIAVKVGVLNLETDLFTNVNKLCCRPHSSVSVLLTHCHIHSLLSTKLLAY